MLDVDTLGSASSPESQVDVVVTPTGEVCNLANDHRGHPDPPKGIGEVVERVGYRRPWNLVALFACVYKSFLGNDERGANHYRRAHRKDEPDIFVVQHCEREEARRYGVTISVFEPVFSFRKGQISGKRADECRGNATARRSRPAGHGLKVTSCVPWPPSPWKKIHAKAAHGICEVPQMFWASRC